MCGSGQSTAQQDAAIRASSSPVGAPNAFAMPAFSLKVLDTPDAAAERRTRRPWLVLAVIVGAIVLLRD